jgi:hypothetical protein
MPTLPAVMADPATATLPAVMADPATATLPAVMADPATATLPAVDCERTVAAELIVTMGQSQPTSAAGVPELVIDLSSCPETAARTPCQSLRVRDHAAFGWALGG